MYWHELTSDAIEALDRELPVVIPLGSCEQHGHHLPVFTDTFQLEAITSRLEARLSDRLVMAPVLWLGASHHHMDFPGALSVPPKLYSEVIQSLADCFLRHGFRRLFFLNGHGGNLVPASHALTDLIVRDDRADAGSIALASWWSVAAYKIGPNEHGMQSPQLTHACEYETSLVLAIREDLVRLAGVADGHEEKARPWTVDPRWAGKVEGFHRFHRWTSSGHMGNPAAANAEKGRSLLEAIVAGLAEFLEDFGKWPYLPVMKAATLVPNNEAHRTITNRPRDF